ncbi:LysR substrate-binding domain-containing protein [Mesorhizobium sp. YM1C-6-2]|uniref:LysR substrate-binding domain-containing protein n=1 Tax=Mesorhizobium sp. YM1C-6-2 TaxID=1827501 RepID=UPI000EF1D599|nr:LysR substrate-binding domain-containing protein [Mesorhizobium sp. YM1C-6-2]RLP24457.1 LysR family transcriptional regulator [Mesorhizobium sp. YM1C-6-2]
MKRGRLPLTALRSFEAAGRHLSFSRAAEELFVSQAAISRQIRELEAQIGQQLFERLHRRVVLTEAGQDLLGHLTQSFDTIDRKLTEIQARPRDELVRVSTEPFFAGTWLIPRLNHFHRRHPGIDVAVDVSTRLTEFRTHEADLAVRHSEKRSEWPRTQSRHLFDSPATPVVSPDLLAKGPPLETVADLVSHTLLHEENRDGWARWLKVAGAESVTPGRGPIFADGTLTTRAAALGHGVALGDLFMNAAQLREGSLVQPYPVTLPFGSYWMVAPDFDALSPSARIFADWLIAEVRAELEAL